MTDAQIIEMLLDAWPGDLVWVSDNTPSGRIRRVMNEILRRKAVAARARRETETAQ